jgi:GT2 family glycosyltransferase
LPSVSIVIVNYCQWEETAALTRQILRSAPSRAGEIEVVIVDNHSPGHPLIRRLRRWPNVSLRRWSRNRGFARAVNEGWRLSRGTWLLLLNPDVTLEPGFLEEVVALIGKRARITPDAGIIGFHLRDTNGTHQLSCGRFPSLWSTLARLTLPRSHRKYSQVGLDHASPVPWVTGCCWLVKRACLEQLDGLDEDFFLYYEDVDFCRRARALGWSAWYEPRLRVVHHRPLHSRPVGSLVRVFTRHALLTYASKHWGHWQFLALSRLIRSEAWFRALWARWRRRPEAAAHFQEMASIGRDIVEGSPKAACRRLNRLVRNQELTCGS